MKNENYISVSDIESTTVHRMMTGMTELDWLYGLSKHPFEAHPLGYVPEWGMPEATMSMWAAAGGVGKSRLAITLARMNVQGGKTVLYFQNEVDLPTFASWVHGSQDLSNFFCSQSTSLSDQIEIVRKLKPDFVFVDSINLIDEFGTGRDENVRQIVNTYRSVINETRSHVVFLCQLSKDGKAKGSTSVTHMPDITFTLTKEKTGGRFRIAVLDKHRYGRTGEEFFGIMQHTETGVECVSSNHLSDEVWCECYHRTPVPRECSTESTLPPVQVPDNIPMPESEPVKDPEPPKFFTEGPFAGMPVPEDVWENSKRVLRGEEPLPTKPLPSYFFKKPLWRRILGR